MVEARKNTEPLQLLRHIDDSKMNKDLGMPVDQELMLADQRGEASKLEKRKDRDSMIQLDRDDLLKLTLAFPSANHQNFGDFESSQTSIMYSRNDAIK